jgi:glycosyltransferase involved in cell wall biosynthesis
MKLLFVHQNLGAFGGAEASIHLTAQELQRRGHESALLYTETTGENEEEWRSTFPFVFSLPKKQRAVAVAAALARFQPEAIYVHNMADLEVLESLTQAELPLIRMVHDHEMYCMRGYKYNYFTREICTRPASPYCVFPCLGAFGRNRNGGLPLKWVSYSAKKKEIKLNQKFDRLLVYSQYSKSELLRNGFDPQKIELQTPVRCWGKDAAISSFPQRNLILYAGQILRGKAVDLLLKALAQVEEPFEAVILGEGNHRPYCERLCARLGLDDRVQFKGFISRQELKTYYLESSVFVVSSLWPEPFGLTGPEAMRYGLPVVAFDAGGIREWLIDGETGFLVPWRDTRKFAQRINELLRNKELARRLGQRGLEFVNENFNSTRQIDRLETLFRELIRINSRSGAEQWTNGTTEFLQDFSE